MNVKIFFNTLVTLIFLASTQASLAQTAYITDSFFVPMRSGPSNGHRIIKNLRTGNTLSIIARSEDDKWIQVSSGGESGWVPAQYVMNRPTARIALERAQEKIQGLEESNTQLKQENQQINQQKSTLDEISVSEKQTIASLSDELEKVKDISSNAIQTDRAYQKLLEEHEVQKAQLETMRLENTDLRNDQRSEFMWYGAILIVLGMIIMSIISAYKSRPRYSDWK